MNTKTNRSMANKNLRADISYLPLLLLFFCLTTLSNLEVEAQEIYRVSWTLQDSEGGLQQPFASALLDSLNFWLTRENPEAQTVRIDDKLRVTIVGLYDPLTNKITERVVSIQAGNIVVRDDPRQFIDSNVVDSLLRRNYFWKGEEIDPLDPERIPEYYRATPIETDLKVLPSYDEVFVKGEGKSEVSLDRSRYYLPNGLRVIAMLGFQELALPSFSYQRLRIGVEQGTFQVWYEVPIGLNLDKPLGGPNAAAHGAGMAFNHTFLGGNATFSNAHHPYGISADTGYMLTKSATLYGILPIAWITPLKGRLRLKAGAAVIEDTRLIRDSASSENFISDQSTLAPRLFLRGELRSLHPDGYPQREGSLQVFGETLSISWFERLGNQFGIRAGGTIRGLLSEPRSFESSATVWITPVIFLK